ncbi:MAG: chemotaxis-specific protein-glutamate methyltransferase CheB [Acidobacteriota bacterium]
MSRRRRIRVAVVDDSTFIRKALARMLGDHPQIELVGTAGSGEELLAHFDTWVPDAITLDLDMPGMGGLATLDHLMARRPTPVIILSTHSGEGAPQTIEALHRGATDFIDKQSYSLVDFEALRAILLEKIFQVTGFVEPEPEPEAPAEPIIPAVTEPEPVPSTAPVAFDLIAIGASTGGPPTIQRLLEDLGGSVPVPVVIAQHMPVGFTRAFAERLHAYLPMAVREPVTGERLLPDTVYIAPAGQHLRITRTEDTLTAELSKHPNDVTHIPSVDVLFQSIAMSVGRRAVGILLTGMGRDGAQGLLTLKGAGGFTIAQDEVSSVVYGMPRAAALVGAAREIVALNGLGKRLGELLEDGDPERD